jgi:protein TonB
MTAPNEWNTNSIKSYVEGFLVGTGKDKVSELDDDVYSKMMGQVIQMKENTIEEIVEIKEVYPNSNTIDPDAEVITEDIPFAIIEEVPHFEECTGTNAEIKKCTSDKITSFVNKNFNTGLAKDLSGRHKISVQFKIDQNGNVVAVQSRAKHPKLKDEAARVIHLLPQMLPGKQNGQPVGTIYALPIIFEIKD